MMRYFNTEGTCRPEEHYMVRLDGRLGQIKKMLVDRGKYFIINRGRQYGKTTTLQALRKYLASEYIVFSLDFQLMGTEGFSDEAAFSRSFINMLSAALRRMDVGGKEKLMGKLSRMMPCDSGIGLRELFAGLSGMCEISPRPIVLMIDEVDSAGNHQVFIDFLAQLRGCYLNREETPIFHSVVLAGVYNIKNLKLKLRPEAEHQYNSPWNIAVKFKMDMSFSSAEIAGMLQEYEGDHHTGMDIQGVAEEVYAYTSGYPVLVSSICKYIDEDITDEGGAEGAAQAWSKEGVRKAVKMMLVDNAPLFESMIKHLNEYPEMKQMFQAILFQGREFAYSPDTKEINLACMFGYADGKDGKVRIANRIFETRLYNYFLSEEELSSVMGAMAQRDKSCFIHGGHLDMDTALKKFVEYFTEIYGDNDEKFIEAYGRKFFLLYLRPIINGAGNYYIDYSDFRFIPIVA